MRVVSLSDPEWRRLLALREASLKEASSMRWRAEPLCEPPLDSTDLL